MDRYRVALLPDGRNFGILDREKYDWCGLPDENGRAKRLEWPVRPAAESWLEMCYRRWAAWESDGGGKSGGIPPEGWRRRRPQPSPWDRGIRYYN